MARRRSERGFALLEILVAFVILALGLGAISTGVVVAMRSDARTQVNRTALRVAQSRLEAAGISEALAPGTREGLIANKFRWRQTVTELRPASDTRPPQGARPAPANGALTVVLGRSSRRGAGRHRHQARGVEACDRGEAMTRAVRNRLIARVAARRRGEQGLTLIELLLSLAILAILTGFLAGGLSMARQAFRRRSRQRDRK